MDAIIKTAERKLKLGALLTFIGINLKYVSGNLMKALILFNILKSGNPEHSYEIHVPNIPDICSDVVTVIIFIFAYFFLTSALVKNAVPNSSVDLYENGNQYPESTCRLLHWSKGIFWVAIAGFGLYFLSKYFLSIGLEVFIEEDKESALSSILVYLEHIIKMCSALILVYAYCKYLSPNKSVKAMLYIFFVIRNLFATNLLGLITQYDLYPCAPVLDTLSPIILIYSTVCIVMDFV